MGSVLLTFPSASGSHTAWQGSYWCCPYRILTFCSSWIFALILIFFKYCIEILILIIESFGPYKSCTWRKCLTWFTLDPALVRREYLTFVVPFSNRTSRHLNHLAHTHKQLNDTESSGERWSWPTSSLSSRRPRTIILPLGAKLDLWCYWW